MHQTVQHSVPSSTRDAIVRTAQELMVTRSYLGFTFQELAERIGIRKASLYHHFPSKEALGIEVVDEARRALKQWQDVVAALSARDRVLAYIHLFRNQLGAGTRVCLIGATAGEWSCLEPGLQVAVRSLHLMHLEWLRAVATEFSNAGQSVDAPRWAAQINAICQGALLNARMHDDVSQFDVALAPLVGLLDQSD